MEKGLGFELLVILCPQTETLPRIGGGIVCSDEADENVWIGRSADLKSRPEFAMLARENKSITISDFLAYYIQFFEKLHFTDFRLLENIDRVVNVIDPQTNETIATAPAKYVEMSYLDPEGRRDSRDYDLFVMGNDGNTGYILTASLPSSTVFSLPEKLPLEEQQIFDSFELLQHSNNSSIISSSPSLTTASSSPAQQQRRTI
jgi:hypothetical protein